MALGIVGVLAYRSRESAGSRIASAIGGILSAAILVASLLAPAVLNPYWASEPADATDPNACVVVARNKTRGEGRPLQADEWVDAIKEGIRQDDLFIQLQSIKTDRLPDKGATTFLLVNLRLDQMRDGRAIKYERFANDKHQPKLTDDSGREYAFLGERVRKAPSKLDRLFMADQLLVFEMPSQVQSLNLALPASAWGRQGTCRFHISEIVNEPPPDMAKQIADTKAMLRRPARIPPEPALGRVLFAKNCQECHTIFGVGGKTGPDLTKSKRNDPDFLLTSIINPSAVIEKKYQPTFVTTTSGVVYNGIIQKEDANAITLLVPSKLIVVPRDDIEEMRTSNVSIMPTDLLREFTEHDVRSLYAYLTGTSQTPMLATAENVSHFFPPAQDLSNWHANGSPWTVDRGILAAPEPVGGKASQLISDLHVGDDFIVTFRFNPGKDGRGAVLIGDAGKPDLSTAIRVELAAGEIPTIVGAGGNITRAEDPGMVKADSWSKLDIIVAADRIRVKINDEDAVSAAGITFPARRTIALEGSGAAQRDVRFRNLGMRLIGLQK
jgi:putative heme-binding domain-containing protein